MRTSFEFQLTEKECIAVLRFNQKSIARQSLHPFLRCLLFALYVAAGAGLGIATSQLADVYRAPHLATAIWICVGAFYLVLIGQYWLQSRGMVRWIAGPRSHLRAPRELHVEDRGLRLSYAAGESFIAWSGIHHVEHKIGSTLIFLDQANLVPIPDSAFESGEERQWFHAIIKKHLKLSDNEWRPSADSSDAPEFRVTEGDSLSPSNDAAWRNLRTNLKLGLRGALFSSVAVERITASWPQLFLLIATSLAVSFASDFARVGPTGQFVAYGLPGALFSVPVLLLSAWAVARLAGQSEHTLMLAVIFSAISVVIDACYLLFVVVADGGAIPGLGGHWAFYAYYASVTWLSLAAAVVAIRLLGMPMPQRFLTLLLAAVLLWTPLSQVYRNRTLWTAPYDESAAAENRRRLASLASEDAFYLQPKLLERELAALSPGKKGVIDLYFLGVAGYAGQDVFMKEVQYVNKLFQERFGTGAHSMTLINNAKTVANTPIASATSLRFALKRIGETMEPDEDILFLFLTSHGSKDHKFSLDFWPMQFKDLDPERLRAMLDESGIKFRVIVASGCYSGGFIDTLKDENSLVITASAPDKQSFGCSNESDFTFFGKAFFHEALQKTDSFVEAFELARPVIAAREEKEDYVSSDPRIFVGEGIKASLQKLSRQRSATTTTQWISPDQTHFQTIGKYEELVALWKLPDLLDKHRRDCLYEMSLGSPSEHAKKHPEYYGGLNQSASHWSRIVAAWENYAADYCAASTDLKLYRKFYVDSWRAIFDEREIEAALNFYKTAFGQRLLNAELEVSNRVSSRLLEMRAPLSEKAIERYQAEQALIMAEYQRDLAAIERSRAAPH